MGKLQQLRAKALSLRGALALGGAVVVAASMTQVVGTLAAPDEVRTAKLGTSSENYFPTPLATNISCVTTGSPGLRYANVSWNAPVTPPGETPIAYKYRVTWSLDANSPKYTFDTSNTSTGKFRVYDKLGPGSIAKSYRIFIQTINPDNSAVLSSGSVSWTVYSYSTESTYCTGDAGFQDNNEPWENQRAWGPTMESFAGGPGSPMFTTLMDTLNSEEMLEPLPEDAELANLDAAAAKPAPTSEAKPTESETGTTGPSPTSPSAEAAPSTEAEDGSTENSTSSSTRTAPSTPRTSTSGTTKPAVTATSSRAVPAATKVTVSATRTTTADPQPTTAPPATTTAPTVRAGVGDDPIAVGANFARLDEADGQPHLVITTAGGAQVCTANLPGATRITSAAGELTITVDGRTHTVDTGTCAID